jgi:hypothetical protein
MKLKFYSFTFLSIVSLKCFSQWNSDPSINTAVSVSANHQQDARIVTDTKAGAIISWVDFRNDAAAADIYVQRLNFAGVPQWTTNGVAVCTDPANQTAVASVEAGNGSAIMTWQDWRSGNRDIYAQKVDSSGNILWTSNGVPVCVKANHQSGPKLISDNAGGAIIVWEDSAGGSWDIYAQRINSSGAVMWTTAGVVICNAPDSQINPKLKTDGAGGAIITWQDKRNGIEYHLYAQRINASGIVMWAANGVVICNAAGGQTNPKIEIDGAGGGIIGWQDKRNGLNYDVYAQRINASGVPQWTANGVMVCNAAGSQSALDITTDMVNGAIISWKDDRSGLYEIYANKVSPAGIIQWAAAGVQIAPGINPNIIGDASGGAIITWQDSTTAGGTWNVYSQRLNDVGVKQWTSPVVAVAIANGGQSSPKNIAAGNGGSIYCWQDKRSGLDLDIYAHRLAANGTVSSVPELNQQNEITCFPNPFNSQTTIKINSSATPREWTFTVFDATGRKVLSVVEKNTDTIILGKNNLQNGVYFYQVVSENQVLGCGKLMITD